MSCARPSKFAHVVYRTRRFAEMLEWYRLVFDARIQHENPALAFLTYDGEHHRFAFANLDVLRPGEGGADDRGLVGVDHVAYTYASVDDLLDNYERLRDSGVQPYWCVHHGVTVSMYYRDPDGNQMEFQVDCFESSDLAAGYMNGPAFGANPVGVEYDPEAWLATRRESGSSADFLELKAAEPVSPIRGKLGEVPAQ